MTALDDMAHLLADPECSTELWWQLAAVFPIEAIASPLYPLLTLETPEKWCALEEEHLLAWIDGAVAKRCEKHANGGPLRDYSCYAFNPVMHRIRSAAELDIGGAMRPNPDIERRWQWSQLQIFWKHSREAKERFEQNWRAQKERGSQ